MKQKHFMDIVKLVEEDSELTMSNAAAFTPGDQVVIQEKVDGANASFRYDTETCKLIAFSRKLELSPQMGLNGFYDFVQTLNPAEFKDQDNYVFFGEWLLKNSIKYHADAYFKWYVFDIYDVNTTSYLSQDEVKKECEKHGFIYVKTFYEGPFISWEHVRSFVGQSDIALNLGEGVVIKNQTKLNDPNDRSPFVLKIVGEHFKERRRIRHVEKILDPQKLKEKERVREIVYSIVTPRRVEKELFKMRDEGLLPDKLQPQDLKVISKHLPKRIYDDCLKEEKELVFLAGDMFGKESALASLNIAKKLILGE